MKFSKEEIYYEDEDEGDCFWNCNVGFNVCYSFDRYDG